jgi:hypothetical protein
MGRSFYHAAVPGAVFFISPALAIEVSKYVGAAHLA